jgi:hypothetical protein
LTWTGAALRAVDAGAAGLAFAVDPEGALLAFATGPGGALHAVWVDPAATALAAVEPALGLRAMPIAPLALADREVTAGVEGIAAGPAAIALHRGLVARLALGVAAVAGGVTRMAASAALAYAADRYQGGQQIIDHSHLRGLLGAMAASARCADGVVAAAAARPDDLALALAAKIEVTERALAVTTDAVQVLGGYGYMREYGLERAMRDAMVLALLPIDNARARLWLVSEEQEGARRG